MDSNGLMQFAGAVASGAVRVVDLTFTLSPDFPVIVLPPEFVIAPPSVFVMLGATVVIVPPLVLLTVSGMAVAPLSCNLLITYFTSP